MRDGDLVQITTGITVAISPASGDGDFFIICTSGPINVGAPRTVGEDYVVSGDAGKIMMKSDLIASQWYTRLGSASQQTLLIYSRTPQPFKHHKDWECCWSFLRD